MASENIYQLYLTNPITTNQSLDLMYMGRSPYGTTNDAVITYENFLTQFLQSGTTNQVAYYPAGGQALAGATLAGSTGISITFSSGTYTWALTGAGTVSSITGTINQVLANGTTGVPETGAVTLTLPQNIATTSSPTFSNLTLTGANIYGSNSNVVVNFNDVGGAVNSFVINNAISGGRLTLNVQGPDSNIPVLFQSKGTGELAFSTDALTNQIHIYTGTSSVQSTFLNLPSGGGANTVTFPNYSGTLVMATNATVSNGVIPIGNGTNFTAATLTAGTNISVTNGAGSVTIAATGAASFTWTTIAGTTQSAAVQTGYIPTNGSLTSITLPTTFAAGDRISVQGQGAGGWNITAGGTTTIQVGASSTSAGGSIASANRYDSVNLIGIVANTTWATLGGPQSTGLTIS